MIRRPAGRALAHAGLAPGRHARAGASVASGPGAHRLEDLVRFADANGATGLYHETITWAFLLLIRERMERGEAGETWEGLVEANPDLLTWKPSVLDRYYRPETIGSELARRVFVMPDRIHVGT